MRNILLSEGSSLTSRETLTTLSKSGFSIDILSSSKLPISAFSRWRHKIIHTTNKNQEPLKYLNQITGLLKSGKYMAILPTHEEAWLFAESERILSANVPITIASSEAFRKVQGKIAFAKLAKELKIPQPRWQLLDESEPINIPYPYWIKADYGTAGRSVYKVNNKSDIENGIHRLSSDGGQLLAQENICGRYGQVQAVFSHGQMIAVHTSMQTSIGVGGSAAARLSVNYPETRQHINEIGKYLSWHGSLTLDFIYTEGSPYYIECNPRIVEPANAERAGVNFAEILIDLSSGKQPPQYLLVGKAGVKTHSTMAMLMGIAERTKSRKKLLKTLWQCIRSGGSLKNSKEVLTPVFRDPLSVIPLAVVLFRLLINPYSFEAITNSAIKNYCVSPKSIETVAKFPKQPVT